MELYSGGAGPAGKKPDLIETILLFFLFFPLFTGNASLPRWADSGYYLSCLGLFLPQIALMVWRMRQRGEMGERGSLARTLFLLGLLYALAAFVGVGAAALGRALGQADAQAAALAYQGLGSTVPRGYLPLAGLLCLAVGYREELYFRARLIPDLIQAGLKTWAAVLFSAALFACLHYWEGWLGCLAAFLMALLLGFWYARRRNAHEVALAHAAYNFLALAIAST
jgi:membrane protease YdiL (CAAX protease family)